MTDSTKEKIWVASGVGIVLLFLFWLFCLNHVSPNHVGVEFNSVNGQMDIQPHPGWYVTSPLTRVCTLDTRPMRVTIPSEARIINSKIIRLVPEKAVEFVRLQGFSIELGNQQENVMLGYAYSGKQYEWLQIIEEGKMDASIR